MQIEVRSCLCERFGLDRMKVIGTIGMNGSGKDTVIRHISKKYGIPVITIGDLVRQAAARCKLEPTRENLTRVAFDHMRKYGIDYFPREVLRIIEQNRWEAVGVAGIRSHTDVETFRKRFGRDFILLFVDVTDPFVRFQRIQNRGESRDPKTLDEFLEQDKKEEENFHLSRVTREAGYTLKNDKGIKVLFAQVDKLMVRILGCSAKTSCSYSNLTR